MDISKLKAPRVLFNAMEIQLLMELIRKKLHIIECKETNKVSSQRKNEAFEEIAKVFNASVGVSLRTAKQLRQKYENIKKDASKLAALQRIETRKTGGGTVVVDSFENLEETVLSMGVITKPLTTRFDCDTSYLDYTIDQDTSNVNDSSLYDEDFSNAASLVDEPSTNRAEEASGRQFGQSRQAQDGHGSQAGQSSQAAEQEMSQAGQSSQAAEQQQTSQAQPSSSQALPGSSQTPRVTAREVLNMFRRGTLKKKPAETASSRASKAILEETKLQMSLKRKQDEREDIEHDLRVKLLKKQIQVQEKMLEIMEKNPQNVTFNINNQ